jgi:ABC-type transport system involved in multi-copper enzyme maturation permease subunit
MRQAWVIGINIFRQLLRNRILTVLAIFALGMGGLSVFLGELGQESEARLGRDFGLLGVEWIGYITVLLCHVVLLFEETELKTITMLLVKPVARWQYLLGKLVGSSLLAALNVAGLVAVLLLVGWWRGYSLASLPFFLAAFFLLWQSVVMSAVVLLFSVLASTVPACVVYSTFTFFLGHFTGNLVEWMAKLNEGAALVLVKVLYYLLPNLAIFNLGDSLPLGGENIKTGIALSASSFLWPLAYGAIYALAVMLLAAWQYHRKEI